ncbi:hypothetical protein GCM10017779_61690 [Streptomyces capillispiralis]|uniref:Uncharacterized protein n=1 Tax=Streptomyces capillispiralis TaxID=68182 RepID=A0A561TS21_9ACTN|nr:hypothetical protein FHX78_116935 [Streptomyces capillispiralis]GHH95712.1 hypothetical protein GCM10017779_61690 [Streptomyces capillispiralis]
MVPSSADPVCDHPLMSIEDHVVVNPVPGAVRQTGGMAFGGGTFRVPDQHEARKPRDAANRLLHGLVKITEAGTVRRSARPMTASGLPIARPLGPDRVALTGHGTLRMTLAPRAPRSPPGLSTT